MSGEPNDKVPLRARNGTQGLCLYVVGIIFSLSGASAKSERHLGRRRCQGGAACGAGGDAPR